MIENWEDKLWEIAERYNTSKPVSGDWSTETEHELNAIAEELGISKYSAQYLMISRLGFSEDMFDNSDNEDSFTTEEAVQEAFPNISEHTVDIISRWYNNEGASEDFSNKEEFAEYIKGDFRNMFWSGDYNNNDFHEVAKDMINAGYYDSSDFPYDNEIESSRQIKSGFEEYCQKKGLSGNDKIEFKSYCTGNEVTDDDFDESYYLYTQDNGFDKENSSGPYGITSARYIATDPESGEVLGSADTYEEAVNEWGEDVIITDSDVAEEEQEEQGLFSSYDDYDDDEDTIDIETLAEELKKEGWNPDIVDEVKDSWIDDYNITELTDDKDMEFRREVEKRSLNSSKKPTGDKAFLSSIVSSVLTHKMSEEQAVKRLMLRNNCNTGYAKTLLTNALEDESLISSGTMELASDLNQDFNADGDFYSWTKDYMPDNGKASTVGGEILRAANQIIYRYQNDGDRINVGNGKETVNPAARYLIDKCVGWTGSSEIEDMLSGANDTNSSDEYYSEWVEDLQVEIEDYLRNHEELFHTANQDDMWDYKTSEDDDVAITSIFIEDDDGNRYSFQGGPEGWHCYDIYYANKPKFNVGDVVPGDEIGNPTDEYTTFEDNGFMYSAEKVEVGDDWEITDVQFEGQLVHKDEEWTTDELERYQIYNAEDESQVSVEDLY